MSPPLPTVGTEYYHQSPEDLYMLSHQLGLSGGGSIDPILLNQNDPLFTSFSYGRDTIPEIM
ncbi:2988_t:CDS:2 [Diversispora eburnea]|uniref:2988_t:CDS:1 n=1 Tax=Diversispora eburnea TaxID=1213867 RepID=A0A9N9F724_9GLOM|nr:2988_t:CDS:2 [Diversispora eburnea]